MFAVIRTGGKQYKVAANDVLFIEKLPGEHGEEVEFKEILAIGEGSGTTFGAPLVSGAVVTGTVLEQKKDDKVIVFKKRRRQNSRRKNGHRQLLTVVRIDGIYKDAAEKPARAARPAPAPKAEAPAEAKSETKKPAAKAKAAAKPAAAKPKAKAAPKSGAKGTTKKK
ncbi:MAG: 50S ribosomal protein L21 [Gemmatimonas sp.]